MSLHPLEGRRVQQWVFRLGVGVTIDGVTLTEPNGSQVMSGDVDGPWTIRAPAWARAALCTVQSPGAGGLGGGGPPGTNVVGGGSGAAGGCYWRVPVIVTPSEALLVEVGAGLRGGVGNRGTPGAQPAASLVAGTLFGVQAPIARGASFRSNASGSGGTSGSVDLFASPVAAFLNGPDAGGPALFFRSDLASITGAGQITNPTMPGLWGPVLPGGVLLCATGAGGSVTPGSIAQAINTASVIALAGATDGAAGGGGAGGISPFALAGVYQSGGAGSLTVAGGHGLNGGVMGFGCGGGGGGGSSVAAGNGGNGADGIVIIEFLESAP
jgi:hypothetical protein